MAAKRKRHHAWFIVDRDLVYGFDNRGNSELRFRTKRGAPPSGALAFTTKAEAERELSGLQLTGDWPLFIHDAWVEEMEWT